MYNVQVFKAHQEKGGQTYGARDIANLWAERVRLSAGQERMTKPGTIDACLTIYNRLFNIPECECLLQERESIYGAYGPWSSIWSLQEVISRCGAKPKMIWVKSCIHDWLQQCKD